MKNGRKNRNSKAWSACGSWDKKKNDEKLVTATRALSMCSSGFWLFRNERRRSGSIEPIHPRRPRECSSNRLSTTLQSGNLIIHTGRTNEENKDTKVLRERTVLISMGSVFFSTVSVSRNRNRDSSLKNRRRWFRWSLQIRRKTWTRIRESIDSRRIKKTKRQF